MAIIARAGTGRGGWGGHNQRYTSVVQPSNFSKPSTWGGSRNDGKAFFGSSDYGAPGSGNKSSGFSQNRFSALNSEQNIVSDYRDEEEKLLEGIIKDMEVWESSGQWMFSCYSPMKEKPNISGFPDFSPEELHLEYYNCRANNNIQNYINSVQQLINQSRNRLLELKTLNASTKVALVSELKNAVNQPLPTFGFGQQPPTFGSSSFPLSSNSSRSANNFSFNSNTGFVSSSSGSTTAFGTPSTVPDSSALDVTSSSRSAHSIGFGSQPALSAASFSFKKPETASGFGASGFSGFGSSSVVNSSNTTSFPAFGAVNAAAAVPASESGNSLFGQSVSAFGYNVAPAPPAATSSITSDKLFTPKTDLSAEDLKQFEAKKFMLGKIPLKPPPIELLNV
ncbi:nucleoporin NUP42 isoform X2 [Pelodiscus sinensis]|uniref:Nucleoporin 42 n=2 Tax=Pelodiscus sinensis TaxID=13735 RepID=K7G488_PELSI|nr:nucleoporin-like protein 2 isoform X1 [Pelodiscus sinensis]|eukprot:XP_006138416.1 nucleoporin-like protein 2 isoform X1 [Pelodiscus sinensis]